MAIPNLLRGLVGPGGQKVKGNAAAGPSAALNARFHVAIADIIAGLTLLAAIPGFKYRVIGIQAIAIGGSAGTVTTVDVKGVQATSTVKLFAFAQAQLTRSTVLAPGITGTAVLADGASYGVCDVNTPITIGQTGSSIDTATFVDIILDYCVE